MLHPILEVIAGNRAALKSVAGCNPTFMSTADKAQALAELVALQAQGSWPSCCSGSWRPLPMWRRRPLPVMPVSGWRMRPGHVPRTPARTWRWRWRWTVATRWWVMRCGTVPRTWPRPRSSSALWTGSRGTSRPTSWAWRRSGWSATRASSGPVSWPGWAGGSWTWWPPRSPTLRKRSRLAGLEEAAHRKTRLGLRRVGDGTTRITGLLPDAAATRLATYLEAFTNPRKDPEGRGPVLTQAGDPLDRLPYPRRLGEAFLHLLEVVDPKRLPVHGGDATTLLITIPLESLRTELATAEVIGASHVPGDDDPCFITAAEARRLACSANLIPMVLGSDSEILDQGRAQRLFTAAQRKALIHRDRHCRAEGLRHPRHLVRSPPLDLLGTGRTHRHRQRRPALPTPPPTHPRRHLPRRTAPHRRHQIPPTQIDHTPDPVRTACAMSCR